MCMARDDSRLPSKATTTRSPDCGAGGTMTTGLGLSCSRRWTTSAMSVLLDSVEVGLAPDDDEVVAIRLGFDQHVAVRLRPRSLRKPLRRRRRRPSNSFSLASRRFARGLDQRLIAMFLVGAGAHRPGHGRGEERRIEHPDSDKLRAVAARKGKRQFLRLHAGRRRIHRHHYALEHDAHTPLAARGIVAPAGAGVKLRGGGPRPALPSSRSGNRPRPPQAAAWWRPSPLCPCVDRSSRSRSRRPPPAHGRGTGTGPCAGLAPLPCRALPARQAVHRNSRLRACRNRCPGP